MIALAGVRMVAEALRDPITGVEAQLDQLPRDLDDDRPEPLARILDATSNNEAVTQMGVTDWPVLVVTAENPAPAARLGVGGNVLDVPSFLVSVAYVTRADAEGARVFRDTSYTLEAVMRALDVGLFSAANAPAIARRTRGRVALLKRNGMEMGALDLALQKSKGRVSGAVLVDVHLRNTQPTLPGSGA